MGALSWARTFRSPSVVDITNNLAPGVQFDPRKNGWNLSREDVEFLLSKVGKLDAAELFRTQPNFRAAVDFLARNVAQVGVKSYKRVEDDGRERDRESLVSRVMANPSPVMTEYELLYAVTADLMVFDEAWLMLLPSSFSRTGFILRPVPVRSVHIVSGSEWTGDLKVEVHIGEDVIPVNYENLIHIHGWNADYGASGVAPIDALKGTLSEQIAAMGYRLGVWRNGGQVSSWIYRPKDAPEWGEKGKSRFKESMAAYRADGAQRGGMPVLDDGMEIRSTRPIAKEEQFIEAAQLSLETVCRVFHINPAMVGATSSVTYANMREFRKMLYGETLGPIFQKIQQKLNARLLPMLNAPEGIYLEFDLKRKLAGDFETEGALLQSAVGGPYMTANEARERQNLPHVDGGDELLKPLNMAGAAEDDPTDENEPPEGPEGPPEGPEASQRSGRAEGKAQARKSRAEASEGSRLTRDLLRGVVTKTAERQRSAVLSKIGQKAPLPADLPVWWDAERWNRELKADFERTFALLTAQFGAEMAGKLGADGLFDIGETLPFLAAVAESRAKMVNSTTQEAVSAAIDAGNDPADVFEALETSRGDQITETLHTMLAVFAAVEAAKQIARKLAPEGEEPKPAMKTWVTRSSSPRPAHAAMNGVSVPVGTPFPNGAQWPGDPILGADGVAGCLCGVEVEVEL